jgi:hypothetical protein
VQPLLGDDLQPVRRNSDRMGSVGCQVVDAFLQSDAARTGDWRVLGNPRRASGPMFAVFPLRYAVRLAVLRLGNPYPASLFNRVDRSFLLSTF